ncbi:hypothetical protein TNCV_2589351 [Trichonephila clavipes]|nr:hypothetical protein TNCV_2589351 [Trichonephila clavipes]
MLVKSVGPKVLSAESRVQETGEYFPHLQFPAKIVEIGGIRGWQPFSCGASNQSTDMIQRTT